VDGGAARLCGTADGGAARFYGWRGCAVLRDVDGRSMEGAQRGSAWDASGRRSGGGRPWRTAGGGMERWRSASVVAIGPVTEAVGGIGVGFIGGVNLCECEV
jgi:hypothetical protein